MSWPCECMHYSGMSLGMTDTCLNLCVGLNMDLLGTVLQVVGLIYHDSAWVCELCH